MTSLISERSNLLHLKTLYVIAGITLRFIRVLKSSHPANVCVKAINQYYQERKMYEDDVFSLFLFLRLGQVYFIFIFILIQNK